MEISFDCWDRKEWKKYIEEYVIPIRINASKILNFWNYLVDNYSEIPITDLKENKELLGKILGGISEIGEYRSRSSALFYSMYFGWGLENVASYIRNKEERIEIDVSLKVNRTEFINFAGELIVFCDKILDSAWNAGLIATPELKESEIDVDLLVQSNENIIRIIGLLYKHILEFTINYNEKTRFLWTIRKNTKRFICFQYKKLCENDNFELLKESIGLSLYYSPQLDKKSKIAQKIIDEYTIWQLIENQFGYNICMLNAFLFRNFKERISIYGKDCENPIWESFKFIIPKVKNFEKEYYDYVSNKLYSWKIPDFIDTKIWAPSGKPHWHHEYKIDNTFLTEDHYIPSWSNKSTKIENDNLGISFLDFLDEMSPGLFTGLLNPDNFIIKENTVRIKEEI